MIIGVENTISSPYLEQILKCQPGICREDLDKADVVVKYKVGALELCWRNGGKKPLSISLDYLPQAKRLSSFPAPKQGAFNQALGKRSKTILDLSGGFGGDSLLMSLQGYAVTIVERLPLMAVLIEEAFNRLSRQQWQGRDQWQLPTVVNQDALEFVAQDGAGLFDCLYFDPMFPEKRKRSARSNKQMQFLQAFAGTDEDSVKVVRHLVDSGFNRLAVKRPSYARPLFEPITAQFSSKLVHYDVYIG